jgi:hypothetical protein
MSFYGGSAALVVNKQESDRERRLRLRREEFTKRGRLVGHEPGRPDSGDASRGLHSRGGSHADEDGPGEPVRGGWGGGGGQDSEALRQVREDAAGNNYLEKQSGGAGGGEPGSRESIWEAKKRRYLELYVLSPLLTDAAASASQTALTFGFD